MFKAQGGARFLGKPHRFFKGKNGVFCGEEEKDHGYPRLEPDLFIS
jgi:hypothetical protein